LKLSLADSLDNARSKSKAMYVSIIEKNKKDVRFLVLFGILPVSYGIGIYWLLPNSLLKR